MSNNDFERGELNDDLKNSLSHVPILKDIPQKKETERQEQTTNQNRSRVPILSDIPKGNDLDNLEYAKKKDNPNVPKLNDLPKVKADGEETSIEKKQEVADKAAQEYNEKYKPFERAKEKGIEGVIKTKNGGVSFAETNKIYTKKDGTRCITKIVATGNRSRDFDAANAAMGLEETPDGYVWHHVDDYNAKDGTITLELVEDETHNDTKPHAGGCAQYDAVNGPCYNPPKKGEI